jgi:hypothetical protein
MGPGPCLWEYRRYGGRRPSPQALTLRLTPSGVNQTIFPHGTASIKTFCELRVLDWLDAVLGHLPHEDIF